MNLFMNVKRLFTIILSIFILMNSTFSVFASEEVLERLDAHRAIIPESDSIPNWPTAPAIGAESACMIDVNTGTIIYNKKMDEQHFPASTTKIMTCLLAAENCSMDEIVTFSKEAVFTTERGSSNVGMDVGQSITMEEALYCILLASANEVASAVAEHVAGSIDDFAIMMNERAKELGCENTHFANANGLPNDDHYTTAHDLALIGCEFFKNDQLCKIAGTTYYEIHATATQPDEFGMTNHHKMLLPSSDLYYEYTVGGKTGYTNVARQTLVTCAEKDGKKFVCTVMNDESPYQFKDTTSLFEYGFDNFTMLNIADNETKYNIDNSNFFDTNTTIFGQTKNIFTLDKEGYVILPSTASFEDLSSELDYSDAEESILAKIRYTYQDIPVGSTDIILNLAKNEVFEFGRTPTVPEKENLEDIKKDQNKVIFLDIRPYLLGAAIIIVFLFFFFIIKAILKNYNFSKRRQRRLRKKARHYRSDFDDFDF